ncbi:hypothetical protein U27_03091 [Candidatus Vecturithrix granuli]|uniref:DUF362 domain-containing protein n=1 Tax=Vecturithrix granuli TaxID=1499967 RepID=A0A081BUX4_VECG1|nr:hypothetical protein U27_03091 [Candidatus Vecturithrix granuli]
MRSYTVADSPFRPADPTVYVMGGCGPYANTRAALMHIDLSLARGKRVLLKPNAGRMASAGSGIVTHPQVIAAAIDAFLEAGAEVAVGESPIVGVNALEAFAAMGVTEIAQTRNCPLLDMDTRPFVEVAIPGGIAIQTLNVCPEVFEYDLIVSLPVMKMHMHTGVTLAVKNMKGCLWRRSKVKLHMLPPVEGYQEKPIDIAIADMASVLRPHLAIIDGTVGMEGLGPSAGQKKSLDVVVVSADAFAADAVACRLMGTQAEHIPHLRIGAERGCGVIDLDQITVFPEDWRIWSDPFCPPPQNLTLEFPNITILDRNSCSACQSTLLLFLKRYGTRIFDYFPNGADIHFAIGKGHDQVPEGTLCIGNCTLRHQNSGIFIPGCPPVASQILTVLSGKPSVDTEDKGEL